MKAFIIFILLTPSISLATSSDDISVKGIFKLDIMATRYLLTDSCSYKLSTKETCAASYKGFDHNRCKLISKESHGQKYSYHEMPRSYPTTNTLRTAKAEGMDCPEFVEGGYNRSTRKWRALRSYKAQLNNSLQPSDKPNN